ncbi:MAG TPA: hypothetical protein VKX28_02145 [Xanthobacteraceae bacterium]|nr:hypothetical protein [Xanthobacteraceae bacterium]
MMGASLRWAQELLTSVQPVSVKGPAHPDRAVGRASGPRASVKQARAKYDGDILHIIMQYPGCDDAYVLAFLRTRVHWFGRGTLIDSFFAPSLGAVHAAGRRLETAGEIKIKAEPSPQREALRFYPNNPLWPATGAETTRGHP